MKKKIMVDMSATLIHHGHIRLIKKAKKYGDLIIGLTTDKQVKKYKGYFPELNYKSRREILLEIKGVKKIIPSNWVITQKFLDKHKIDILISGSDYKNRYFQTKTIIFSRTKFISSSLLRKKSAKILKMNYEK
jgi:glycerol-3-phosphate cytidylyltransferase